MTVAFAPVAFLASATVLKTGNPGESARLRERWRRVHKAVTPHPGVCCPPSLASRRRPFWCHMR